MVERYTCCCLHPYLPPIAHTAHICGTSVAWLMAVDDQHLCCYILAGLRLVDGAHNLGVLRSLFGGWQRQAVSQSRGQS
jgi:hypothetical protein